MLKIRRPLGRLIFNMGIAIPGKTVFLIETAPRVFLNVLSSIYTLCRGIISFVKCFVHEIPDGIIYYKILKDDKLNIWSVWPILILDIQPLPYWSIYQSNVFPHCSRSINNDVNEIIYLSDSGWIGEKNAYCYSHTILATSSGWQGHPFDSDERIHRTINTHDSM